LKGNVFVVSVGWCTCGLNLDELEAGNLDGFTDLHYISHHSPWSPLVHDHSHLHLIITSINAHSSPQLMV